MSEGRGREIYKREKDGCEKSVKREREGVCVLGGGGTVCSLLSKIPELQEN